MAWGMAVVVQVSESFCVKNYTQSRNSVGSVLLSGTQLPGNLGGGLHFG